MDGRIRRHILDGRKIKLVIFKNYFWLTFSMTPSGNVEKIHFCWKIWYFQCTDIIFLLNGYRRITLCIALPSILFTPFTTRKFILEQLDGRHIWLHIISTVFKKKSKGSLSANYAWMFIGIALDFSLDLKGKGVFVG